MARTKGKYTPNSCLQVHFQNKSVLGCYLSLSLRPRTVQQMHVQDCTSRCLQGQFSSNTQSTASVYTHTSQVWICHFGLTQSDTLTNLAAPWMHLEYSDKSFSSAIKMRHGMWLLFSSLWILWMGIYGKGQTFFTQRHFGVTGFIFSKAADLGYSAWEYQVPIK